MSAGDDPLATRWRTRAAELRALALESVARAFETCAAELAAAQDAAEAEALTLREAMIESGLSEDHLRKLVAAGRIPNAGRKHAPRIRRADLPRKAGHVPPSEAPTPGTTGGYDVGADARAIAGRLSQGGRSGGQPGGGAGPVRGVA